MNYERLPQALKDVFAQEEGGQLKACADELTGRNKSEVKPMHGSVMPRTYVGKDYGKQFNGKAVPKILMMAINQSREGQLSEDDEGFDPNKVRDSLYEAPFDADGKVRPNGYGPRLLGLNLARLIFAHCGVGELSFANAGQIHDLIAYDNFVKWTFDVKSSTPPEETWPMFYGINRAVVELLKPDIIVCIGGDPYEHVGNVVKKEDRRTGKLEWPSQYGWIEGKKFWWGTLTTPWGHCPYGRVYHYGYSARVSNETDEALVQEYGACECSWWGASQSTNGKVAEYESGLQSVASSVCKALAEAWLNPSDG